MGDSIDELDPEIGLRVFAESCPIPELREHPAGNLDLVLVPFVRSLKQAGLHPFAENITVLLMQSDRDFIFEVATTEGALEVKWFANPIACELPAASPKRPQKNKRITQEDDE